MTTRARGSDRQHMDTTPNAALTTGEDLAVLSARKLSQRAAEIGIDEADIEAADEAGDRKAAFIELIEKRIRESETAAVQEAQLAQLRKELCALSALKLSRRCESVGIADVEVEAADEAEDRKEALISLLLRNYEQQKEQEARLVAELSVLSALKLSQRCGKMGIDEAEIEAADGAHDRKMALIELIVKHGHSLIHS